jgi:transketolase
MFHAMNLASPLAQTPITKPIFPTEIVINENTLTLVDPKALRALILIMDQAAVNGGAAAHWGGPSALAEIISALFAQVFAASPWYESFNVINDIGHAENALYALRALYQFAGLTPEDLLHFRSISSKLTGHGESHLFPEAVQLSNGPLGSAFPESLGLCLADKLLGNKRTTICLLSDGAAMEGEAKEALSTIPGLASKNKLNPYLLIISDNDTKLSGRISADSFSMQPTFSTLAQLGWNVMEVAQGHDLAACYAAIEKGLTLAKLHPNKPVALVVKTVKGKGIKKTEESASGGHGFPLKKYDPQLLLFLEELYHGTLPELIESLAKKVLTPKESSSASSTVKKEKIQAGFAKALVEQKKLGAPIISVSSDLQSSTGLAAFQKEFPESYFDIGIAESLMVNTAAGLSKLGFIPTVDTFAAFGVTKGALPLIMATLSEAPMMGFFTHMGFQDAADGASHQSLTYFSALCSVPFTDLLIPATSSQAEELTRFGVEKMTQAKKAKTHPHSYIYFTGREDAPTELPDTAQKLEWNKPQIITQGTEGLLVASGHLLWEALDAAQKLKERGCGQWTVVNHAFLNHVEANTWAALLNSNKGRLLHAEEHQLSGGIGQYLVGALAAGGCLAPLKQVALLGVQEKFGQSAYSAQELYQKHGICSEAIAKKAQSMIV